jgi:hypothetical protein
MCFSIKLNESTHQTSAALSHCEKEMANDTASIRPGPPTCWHEPEKIFYTPNGVPLEEIEEVNACPINTINLSILEQFGNKTTKKILFVFVSIRM